MSDQLDSNSSGRAERSLPDRPDLHHLKIEAKPRLSSGEFPNLQQAQRAIAHEHGVASWTQLKRLIEEKAQGGVVPSCSFCGRGSSTAGRLFAGLGVWICDVCVITCYGILDQVGDLHAAGTSPGSPNKAGDAGSVRTPPTNVAPDPLPDAAMTTIAHLQQLALAGRR